MRISPVLKMLLVLAAVSLSVVWLVKTPPGLLGKADAIGYAICHRAPARSFTLGDRPSPLCARCSGTFLGALLGLIFIGRTGRRGEMPDLKSSILLGGFLVAFGVDGVNSFARLIPGAPFIYQSENWLRLITGTGLGLGIAALLVPVFNQVVWAEYTPVPSLSKWNDLAALVVFGALLDLAVLSQNPLIFYPLAVISGFAVLGLLSIIYTIVWVLLSKQENRYHNLRELWVPLVAGYVTALLQISLMDAGRFLLTGTWAGFPLPN
jgi:uncharacterized membrane protein